MSNKYKFNGRNLIYFVTITVVYWIDVFTREEYKNIIIESLKHCISEKGLVIHGWVIMTNHLHLIVSAENAIHISNILRDFKKYTANQLLKAIQDNIHESRKSWMLALFKKAGKENTNNALYQFWIQDSHPIYVDDSKDIYLEKLNYIHQNPVKAGFVRQDHFYKYSSAGDYVGKKGMLPIKFL